MIDLLQEYFDEREWRLVGNCRVYAKNDPAGLPGHNLMLIVAKMADLLDVLMGDGRNREAVMVGSNLALFLDRLAARVPPGDGQRHNITLGDDGRLELAISEQRRTIYLGDADMKRPVDAVIADIYGMLRPVQY